MTATLWREETFRAVSPAALAGYVRSLNWVKDQPYRDYSDVYVGEEVPEIIVPRTQEINDYGFVVSRLIEVFAEVSAMTPEDVYRDLVNADRDVIRVRVPDADEESLPIDQGTELLNGARDLLLSTACSFEERRPVYRLRSNRAANQYLSRVRLGRTEGGSFTVVLLPPVVPPAIESRSQQNSEQRPPVREPLERRMVEHFATVLMTTRAAVRETASDASDAFVHTVSDGVSANFCDAMASLIGPFPKLEVRISWALTRPATGRRDPVPFFQDDVPILREAADWLRDRGPKHDVLLFGMVSHLSRTEFERDGRVTLRARVDGQLQSVYTDLRQEDYETAIAAHRWRVALALEGDLERVGQRWHLRSPRVVEVISSAEWEETSINRP